MAVRSVLASVAGLIVMGAGLAASQEAKPAAVALAPAAMARIGTVDPRFQSYNVEMVEVTGAGSGSPMGPRPRRSPRPLPRRPEWPRPAA